MKKIIGLFGALILLVSVSAHAQRGIYGTIQPYNVLYGTYYNNSLVQRAADTLKGVDTVYAYFQFSAPYRLNFTLQTVQTDDSLSGTAVLQAWAGPATGWVTRTGYWESITGQTALCTSCVGASKTYTLQTGTSRSTWDVGSTGPNSFNLWRLRIVGTRATDTTAVTAWATYSY